MWQWVEDRMLADEMDNSILEHHLVIELIPFDQASLGIKALNSA